MSRYFTCSEEYHRKLLQDQYSFDIAVVAEMGANADEHFTPEDHRTLNDQTLLNAFVSDRYVRRTFTLSEGRYHGLVVTRKHMCTLCGRIFIVAE